MSNLFRFSLFGILARIAIFPIHTFTLSNTDAPAGGEGAGLISGWGVSNINYQPSSDPARVMGVEFDLNSPAHNVSVKLVQKIQIFISVETPVRIIGNAILRAGWKYRAWMKCG